MILTQISPNFSLSPFRTSHTMDEGIRVIEKFYGELYKEGERLNELFFIIKGKVALFKRDGFGRRVQLPVLETGGFLGLQTLHNEQRSNHTARIQESCKLLIIPINQLTDFLTRWPMLKQQIMRQLINQLDSMEMR